MCSGSPEIDKKLVVDQETKSMRVERPGMNSMFAVIFIFAAFFAICILPRPANAERPDSASVGGDSVFSTTSQKLNHRLYGNYFYSSGYSPDTPIWPVVNSYRVNGFTSLAANNTLLTASLQFSSANYSINEDGTMATITVTRKLDLSGEVTVDYATSNGSAADGQDYAAASGTLFWADGDDSAKEFTIPITDDVLIEGDETVNLTLSNPTGNAALAAPDTAVLTIVDDEQLPTLAINDVTQAEGNSPNQMIFTVTLSSASQQTVTVNFATTNGSASAPSDFSAVFLDSLTFNPGETEKTLSIEISGDLDIESDETFLVNLSGAVNATVADAGGIGTLTNDDAAAAGIIQFSSSSYTVNEGGGTATITVNRASGSAGAVTVNSATSNGTATAGQDYTATAGTLSWANGDASPKTITIPITDDAAVEGSETVNITLSNPTGGVVIGSPNPAVLTINDNDAGSATISINDVSQAEGNSGNQLTFQVTLSAQSNQIVSVNYATSDGTAMAPGDYTAVPAQTLNFNPGQTQQQIVVNINGDTDVESNESFFVNLSSPVGASIADSQGVGTLTNDDGAVSAGTLQFSSLAYSINENSPTATITVTRNSGTSGAVTVNYATSNGSATAGQDYTASSGILTWASGDGSAKNFTIPILDDNSLEGSETVNISLSSPTGGSAIGSPGASVLTIVDDDSQPSIAISDVSQNEGNGANQMLFNVTLSAASTQTVTVNYSTANGTASAGTDYTAVSPTQIVFNPGEISKPAAVNIIGDFVIETDETLFVNLSGAVNAPIFDTQGVGTLVNDDAAGVIQFESSGFSVSEGSPTAVITVTRTGGLSSGVSVQYFTIDGSATSGQDYTRVSGSLTFEPNQATKTFSIPIINDLVDESDETVNLALDAPMGGASLGSPINAILTIVDNDDPPTLSISDASLNEGNLGQASLTFTVTLTGQSSQAVTVNYSTANGTATAPGDYTAILSSDLTFNPGQTTKQITVQVKGDYDREQNENFFVNLTNPSGATITDAQGTGTILNDDFGGAFRFTSAEYTVGEPSGVIVVSVQRTGGAASGVTVNYSSSNSSAIAGQDYTAVAGTLTFEGGQTVKMFSIPIANDGVAEGEETFNLILSDATGGGTLGVPNTAVVTITDVGGTPAATTLFDYDGDDRADISVFRPSSNIWYVANNTSGFLTTLLGQTGDLIAPADYDGDGNTDTAVFRPSTGQWFIINSGSQALQTFNWGTSGDLPVPADHDGDGKADLVLFRQSNGTWYTRFSNNTFSAVGFGVVGDKPVVGDFDGDGKYDIGLYRPSDRNWYILKTSFGFFVQTWGEAGDIPVPADYDGDGNTDISVWRPSTGQWFRIQSTAGFGVVGWGANGDKPVPADYDGDGKADLAVFRPSNATWYLIGSNTGITVRPFGESSDLPTEGAFIY